LTPISAHALIIYCLIEVNYKNSNGLKKQTKKGKLISSFCPHVELSIMNRPEIILEDKVIFGTNLVHKNVLKSSENVYQNKVSLI